MESETNVRQEARLEAAVGRTREGNDIWPIGATIRNAMPATTCCRTCRHAADLCTGLAFRYEIDRAGKRVLTECSGFEHVQAPNTRINAPGEARSQRGTSDVE
jgi:hypothetical protein